MRKRIAMIVFSYYPGDPRVRREAEALVDSGKSVDVICLRGCAERKKEIVNGVRIFRLPLQRKRGNKLYYLFEYVYFIFLTFFNLSILHIRNHYNLIHVHNMPDILVFSALIPRLMGCKIILDLHDPMPEVYMAKYFINETHPAIRFLHLMEKCSIWFSDLVLTPNIAFRDMFISRGCHESKIQVVMNSPQESIFCKKGTKIIQNMEDEDSFIIMTHGTIVERNGLGVALIAIDHVRQLIPKIVFNVYGDGEFLDQSRELVANLGLGELVNYHGHVPSEKIAVAIQSADVGLIPNKPSIHWDNALPTRIFEYLCLGKPVIAPRTKGILDYFSEESLYLFKSGSAKSMLQVIFDVYSNKEQVSDVLDRGIAVYKKYRWQLQRQHFIRLVTTLINTDASQLLSGEN